MDSQMVDGRFLAVEHFIEKSVMEQLIPGAVLCVTNAKKVVYSRAFGYRFPKLQLKMENATIFDAASLTKVMATLPAIMLCLERGLLDLDDTVASYIPSFYRCHPDLTIKHLLTHTSGLQPDYPFHTLQVDYTKAIDLIAQMEKTAPVNSRVIYSDLNFILLGEIVARVTGENLAMFVQREVFDPLQMYTTTFNPQIDILKIAPTEFNVEQDDYVWGTVHDEKAAYFGGVSGHAGLFTTASDCARYVQMYLKNGVPILQKSTVALMQQYTTAHTGTFRSLGWELYNEGCFSGQYLKSGYGHTGFTGTSLWICPKRDLAVVLLTNRVHYGRQINIGRFRRIVHNLIALAMDEEGGIV